MAVEELMQQAALQIPEEDLKEIVRRIVKVAQPERVILFGSAARGTMGPHSDLDLLVIKRGDYHHITAAQEIHRALSGVEYGTDIIVATPEEVERYRDSYCLVFYPALREGRVVYDRAAPSP
jgi:predicted nucleotidyltransferase